MGLLPAVATPGERVVKQMTMAQAPAHRYRSRSLNVLWAAALLGMEIVTVGCRSTIDDDDSADDDGLSAVFAGGAFFLSFQASGDWESRDSIANEKNKLTSRDEYQPKRP